MPGTAHSEFGPVVITWALQHLLLLMNPLFGALHYVALILAAALIIIVLVHSFNLSPFLPFFQTLPACLPRISHCARHRGPKKKK